MNRSLAALLVVVTVLVALGPAVAVTGAAGGGALAQTASSQPANAPTDPVEGSPEISLSVADNRLSPGQVTGVGVTVMNTGEIDTGSANPAAEQRVTTARGLSLTMRDDDLPFDVRTGEVAVGSVPEGAVGPVTFKIAVDEDAKPGTYRVPVRVEYTYTSELSERPPRDHDQETVFKTRTVELTIEEGARFEVVNATTTAAIGASGTVSVAVENVGTATADAATLALQSTTADLRFTGGASADTYVGTWHPGEIRRVTVAASVARDAERRNLALGTTVRYEDTDGLPQQASLSTGVTPAGEQLFAVTAVETTAATGDTGHLEVTLRNDGGRPVEAATVQFQSNNAALTFGGASGARAFVGEWAPNETRTLTVEAGFAPTAEQRSYAVDATVSYDVAGRTAQARPVTFGAVPADDQSFALEGMNASLSVGQDGRLTGTVLNDGPEPVENAVLVLETPANVNAVEREFAVGDLPAGERAEFAYDLEVSSAAREGPRQFALRVRYEGTDGTQTESDPLYTRAAVRPGGDVFAVDSVDAQVENGGRSQIVLAVTNTGDQELTDISAKLFADDPISVDDSEGFVDRLAPGESVEVRFEVSASGAIAKTYPLSIDFQYVEPDGDTKVSDTQSVPVRVTEPEDEGGLPLPIVGGVALVVVVALAWVGYTRYLR